MKFLKQQNTKLADSISTRSVDLGSQHDGIQAFSQNQVNMTFSSLYKSLTSESVYT